MSQIIVIFGASGDLTGRKLIPALFHLFIKHELCSPFAIVGCSRTLKSDKEWRAELEKSTEKQVGTDFSVAEWKRFAEKLHYFPGDVHSLETFRGLDLYLKHLENRNRPENAVVNNNSVKMYTENIAQSITKNIENNTEENTAEKFAKNTAETSETNNCFPTRLYYLSTSPLHYSETILNLGRSGMSKEVDENGKQIGNRRIIIEKPFGVDRQSAQKLNDTLHQVFNEKQIFRIDHYLGKETVNNIFAFRFANTIFEPLWNRNYIDHIQITANESLLVGRRGAFYDQTGVLRDMFQNHLLQLLTVVTMEAPARFDARSVRDEKVKVLRSIRPMFPDEIQNNILLGQYNGYQEEPGIEPGSKTPTFAAVRLQIDNWRWKDVPIFLRSGKGMSCQTTQIMIQYKKPPHRLFCLCGRHRFDSDRVFSEDKDYSGNEHFDNVYSDRNFSSDRFSDRCLENTAGKSPENLSGNLTSFRNSDCQLSANRLLIQIQPAEAIQFSFLTKIPGNEMRLKNSQLIYRFSDDPQLRLPEAYERLLKEALDGEPSLFARDDEVETAWEIIDPIQRFAESGQAEIYTYTPESWGPDESNRWMENQGKTWFDLCPVLTSSRSDSATS